MHAFCAEVFEGRRSLSSHVVYWLSCNIKYTPHPPLSDHFCAEPCCTGCSSAHPGRSRHRLANGTVAKAAAIAIKAPWQAPQQPTKSHRHRGMRHFRRGVCSSREPEPKAGEPAWSEAGTRELQLETSRNAQAHPTNRGWMSPGPPKPAMPEAPRLWQTEFTVQRGIGDVDVCRGVAVVMFCP